MKYTILFVLAAFSLSLIWACSGSKNTETTTVDEDGKERKVTVYSQKLLSNKWKEVRTKDTYDGIWKDIESDHKIIEFTSDGKYSEDKPGNPTHKGSYTLVNDQLTIEHSGNKVPLVYSIQSLDKKNLTLATQGRHGAVHKKYERIK